MQTLGRAAEIKLHLFNEFLVVGFGLASPVFKLGSLLFGTAQSLSGALHLESQSFDGFFGGREFTKVTVQ